MSKLPFKISDYSLLVTCEHATNQVPPKYLHLFPEKEILLTHKGYDPGTQELAKNISTFFNAPICSTKVSRLLVENNRSVKHPNLFSSYAKVLSENEKKAVLDDYYHSHRKKVLLEIEHLLNKTNGVLHLSIHSFTPNWNGIERDADIGLLYDPSREREKIFSSHWKNKIISSNPSLKVRFNYPYLGVSDSLPTYLRTRFGEMCYLGIEVEVNQKFPLNDKTDAWIELQRVLVHSLEEVIR